MRNALITVVLAAAVAAWLPKQAPVKPDFSGTWKLDPAASVVAPAPGASGGISPALLEPVIVKQTAETLSVTQKPGDDSFTFTYRLDGSTSTLAWPSGPGETVEATAVAKWDSDKLQIATSIPIKGVVYKNTETWSLTRNRLTIELVTSRGKQVRVYSLVRDRERENPRSAPTPALMLASSTDCWEPAIAVGPREQVYIVAGQRRGGLESKEFDQQQVLWRSLDGGASFEGPWPLDAKGHRQADQRIAVDRDGTIYVTYMDHENLNPRRADPTARGSVARRGTNVRCRNDSGDAGQRQTRTGGVSRRQADRRRVRVEPGAGDRHHRRWWQDVERGAAGRTGQRAPLLARGAHLRTRRCVVVRGPVHVGC